MDPQLLSVEVTFLEIEIFNVIISIDNRYLRIGENGIERGYPKSTLQRFPGVAWGVDAGFSFKDGTGQDVIYLFKVGHTHLY